MKSCFTRLRKGDRVVVKTDALGIWQHKNSISRLEIFVKVLDVDGKISWDCGLPRSLVVPLGTAYFEYFVVKVIKARASS